MLPLVRGRRVPEAGDPDGFRHVLQLQVATRSTQAATSCHTLPVTQRPHDAQILLTTILFVTAGVQLRAGRAVLYAGRHLLVQGGQAGVAYTYQTGMLRGCLSMEMGVTLNMPA